ncbi:MAG: tetratricopeptide repeat protein [Micrococcales bacterium]
MVEDLNSRLRGAMDLSALNKKAETNSVAPSEVSLELPALVAEITEVNLRTYLEISTRVPLVIDFYSSQDDSTALSAKLGSLAAEANGAFLLGRIDVEAHKRVAEAFSVQQAATVIAVLKGQPFPLFNGNVEIEQITSLINKLLEVAAGNGVTERITVNESAQPVSSTPKLPKHHLDAAEALNAGENQKALEMYQQILRESPADSLAAAGLAQTELLIRVESLDFEKVLDNSPQNFEELMVFADALIAIGDFAVGFDALLTNYQDVSKEEQQQMKDRLLKYFEIVGKNESTVVAARARLTSMLF